jgi:hypothetical protein
VTGWLWATFTTQQVFFLFVWFAWVGNDDNDHDDCCSLTTTTTATAKPDMYLSLGA